MRLAPLFVIAGLLAACASLPERPPSEDPQAEWEQRQARLQQLDAWELRGRLAVRTEDRGAHASLHWIRRQDVHRVDLAGPFGGGRVRITQDRNGAELRDGGGKVYRDATAEALLARVSGWRLPLDALRYWVVGLPSPQAPARVVLDEWGRPRTLQQLGWNIRFIEYAQHGSYELPRRLFIERATDAGSSSAAEVRLVIDSWALPDSAVHPAAGKTPRRGAAPVVTKRGSPT